MKNINNGRASKTTNSVTFPNANLTNAEGLYSSGTESHNVEVMY